VHILTFQLLFFYLVGNWDWAQASIIQIGIYNFVLHIINIGYGLFGLLDQYTLTIMVHEALLTNAPLFHLFWRYSLDKTETHRKVFILNMFFSVFEFIVSMGSSNTEKGFSSIAKWIGRNKRMCPELLEGLKAVRQHRTNFTLPCVLIGITLALGLFSVNKIDVNLNKGTGYRPPSERNHVRPPYLMWKVSELSPQRVIVSIISFVIFAVSIIILEYCIIADFHHYMRQFPQISSNENGWSYGQLIPAGSAFAAFCYAIRSWLISESNEGYNALGSITMISC
jgi:hypothetical protein